MRVLPMYTYKHLQKDDWIENSQTRSSKIFEAFLLLTQSV